MNTDSYNKVSDSAVTIRDYMPQLDSIRTIGLIFVLIEHWLYMEPWTKVFPIGMTGVTSFFVLSGFLITQILLRTKISSESKGEKKYHSLKQFYARRTLRIFPIYYITIFILYAFNIQEIRKMFLWFLFYSSNIYFYITNDWAGSISHLWTLAVEEQYYIIWPFVILFTPVRKLLKSIIAIIIIGPVYRSVLYLMHANTDLSPTFLFILTPSCMDCFGFGALLAYFSIIGKGNFLNSKEGKIFLAANILMLAFQFFIPETVFSIFFFRLNLTVICMYVIYGAGKGYGGITGKILGNNTVRYFGKISYSMYIFHNFMPMIYESLKLPSALNIYAKFLIQVIMLSLISTVSWYLIEKPINDLKRYFRYD